MQTSFLPFVADISVRDIASFLQTIRDVYILHTLCPCSAAMNPGKQHDLFHPCSTLTPSIDGIRYRINLILGINALRRYKHSLHSRRHIRHGGKRSLEYSESLTLESCMQEIVTILIVLFLYFIRYSVREIQKERLTKIVAASILQSQVCLQKEIELSTTFLRLWWTSELWTRCECQKYNKKRSSILKKELLAYRDTSNPSYLNLT